MRRVLLSVCIVLMSCAFATAETIRLKASDGVEVTADFTTPEGRFSTVLVLYHMAGASRGEYRDIAKALNKLGYATLAVDQRSGGPFNSVKNETAAKVKGRQGFTDAIPDMLVAAQWARQNSGARRVGVIGSSYSAGLVLVLSSKDRNFADAVMSFSPGEYYGTNYVSQTLSGIKVPVFLTAARNETEQWRPFANNIGAPVTGFVPKGVGRHGASALVSRNRDEYWAALRKFLDTHLPAK